jgi:hypothetical protein
MPLNHDDPRPRRSPRTGGAGQEIDLRPVGADGSRPPRLELYLLARLRILLLANILPLIALGILGYLLIIGEVEITGIGVSRLWKTLLVVLVALVVVGAAGWVLLPLARWTRAYPRWCFRHQSRVLWLLPMVGGHILSLMIWLAAAGAATIALWFIISGIADLVGVWWAGGDGSQPGS